jgi:DNA-binding transcriptional LysR family regulator
MASVRAFAKGELGRVELACVPSVASHLLPEVIQTITAQWAGIELDVRDIDTSAVVRAIERGTIEIGIAGRPRTGAVTFQPLFHDRLVLVCPASSVFAEQPMPVKLVHLRSHPFIANGITIASEVPEIQALSAAAKLMVRNTTSILALVRAGVGATILPELAVPEEATEIRLLPLEAGTLKREVGVIRKTDTPLSPAAKAFLEVLTKFVQDRVGHDGSWQSNHAFTRENQPPAQGI